MQLNCHIIMIIIIECLLQTTIICTTAGFQMLNFCRPQKRGRSVLQPYARTSPHHFSRCTEGFFLSQFLQEMLSDLRPTVAKSHFCG